MDLIDFGDPEDTNNQSTRDRGGTSDRGGTNSAGTSGIYSASGTLNPSVSDRSTASGTSSGSGVNSASAIHNLFDIASELDLASGYDLACGIDYASGIESASGYDFASETDSATGFDFARSRTYTNRNYLEMDLIDFDDEDPTDIVNVGDIGKTSPIDVTNIEPSYGTNNGNKENQQQNDDYLLRRDILLRNYQLSLVEKAKRGNTIVYLPTGSGKTLIAVHVLCSRSHDIIGPFRKGGRRAFFVANTQIMVFQLKKVLQTHTKFKVSHYVGSMNVDAWSREQWESQFEEFHVIVLTAEILRLILQLNFIEAKDISLVVLDECHHAVYDHPYRLIIETLHKSDIPNPPLLLGLSAVLLNSSPKPAQVLSKIQNLENLFRGKVISETIELFEVIRCSANPDEKVIFYRDNDVELPESMMNLYDTAVDVLSDVILNSPDSVPMPKDARSFRDENKARRIRNGFIQVKQHVLELGVFGGFLSALFFTILFEKYRLLSQNPAEIEVLLYANTELNKIRHCLAKVIGDEERKDAIFNASSHKVQQLILLLDQVRRKFNDGHVSMLIFVHQRSTAVVLSFLLKRLSAVDERFKFLKVDFITSSSALNRSLIYSERNNEETVKLFASRALNLLVATNLLEEGVDVSACNVVISFDFPLSYPSYFQSRGRARDKESKYYMFVKESEEESKLSILTGFRQIQEKLFEKVSFNESVSDDESSPDQIESMTFVVNGRTVTLDGLTSIHVVNRYCAKLPQDRFSTLSPISWYTVVRGKKKAFVQLPVNCPLYDIIEGEPRNSSKQAKRSAFLATVRKLLEINELDDNFCPRSIENKCDDFNILFPNYKQEKVEKNLPQPGTKKRRQLYRIACSEALRNCLPMPGVKCYLHVFELELVFDRPEVSRRAAIYDILKLPVSFGMLTSKKLREILQFPFFIELGQVNCDLLVNYDEFILTESEISDIKMFHYGLFKNVAGVVKNSHIFDVKSKDHSFFIVPVEKEETSPRYKVQWDVIRCDFCRLKNSAIVRYNPSSNRGRNTPSEFENSPVRATDNKEGVDASALVPAGAISGRLLWSLHQTTNRKPKFSMTEADYNYFVIKPNYRYAFFAQYYIVSKVCHNMSPLSPFPNTDYDNYAHYYKHKYSIEVTNLEQPLLQVAALHSVSNYNKPRDRKSKRNKDKIKDFEEHFIPELCDVFPFDRRFWVKALYLPTVLSRIYHVFYLEEFRRKIVCEAGLGQLDLPPGMSWKPLSANALGTSESDDDSELASAMSLCDLKGSLPLSKLKDKAPVDRSGVLDPEKRMYDVGLCDLEFFVKKLELSAPVEYLALEEENNHLIQLKSMKDVRPPNIKFLNASKDGMGPDLSLLIQASTSTGANDIVNYERLEILGDSFLKFSATLFLFRNYTENEGILSNVKGKIVGNRNLLYCGLEKGFQDVVNVNDFVPGSDWHPPLFHVPDKLVDTILAENADPAVLGRFEFSLEEQYTGVLTKETMKMNEELVKNYDKCFDNIMTNLLPYKTLEDKTVSDCVEAYIAAYLKALGLYGAFEFVMWLKILPSPGASYSELIEKEYRPSLLGGADRSGIMHLLYKIIYQDLEDILDYRFKEKALLLEALTHPSYTKNRITHCYQRLEFLGDAVLDFLITSHLYENCGTLTPGEVTDIRSALVNNVTFACFVVRYELYKFMLSFSSTLSKAIENFVTFQTNRNHVIDDNVLILLEESDCLIAETIQVPKALGDLFESIAGAIFLDSGNSLETVWRVYYRLMKRELEEFPKNIPKCSVKLLQEICGDSPHYDAVACNGKVKVTCMFYYENQEIRTHGFGKNKAEGKRSASKLALNKIIAMKK